MIIRDIFVRDLERPIEGVIKADDESGLHSEIEEYVLTAEVEQHLDKFLSAYNSYQGANGVWISGFFGSGKSHLLKMLALILENRSVEGLRVLDSFLAKCRHNSFLCGELEKMSRIPARSILFNIDQKADVISKTQIDALLGVFVKVFDEMCGYSKLGYVAAFERDLAERGLLQAFKDAYYSKTGRQWEKGREQHILESANIAEAYAAVSGENPDQTGGILNKYRQDYKLSIEDFAEQVNKYIETQADGFRLNFLVDEVGQYIANNTKLMTNLQTIAESLSSRCGGRAWIIVTAQEDMDNIVGEMTKQHGNDFSKIQDRFKNRIKLTSRNVDEVIQKRLLAKNAAGKNELESIYGQERNNFRTLFDFTDNTHDYGHFKDKEHFINCYPFLPYQFSLFQDAIQGLSAHNAFEGRHSSVGERSMLGVFQQVSRQIAEKNIGHLASFDLMFDGIRNSLKSNIQRAVLQVENQSEEVFTSGLLKVLFLVKYVKVFKASVHNLCVLMLNGFEGNIRELTDKVEKTLRWLESQTMIQRNGELYEYLTDQERDIEKEIKETLLENSDIIDELDKIIFEDLLKSRKVKYEGAIKCDYAFSRRIDGVLRQKDYELGIHIISPCIEKYPGENEIKQRSINSSHELFVHLPDEYELFSSLSLYKKTEKYILQNNLSSQSDTVRRILAARADQNRSRREELKVLLRRLVGEADLFVGGRKLDVAASSDAQTRLFKAFQELISLNFPHLKMVDNLNYEEKDIDVCLREKSLLDAENSLIEAEQEIKSFLQQSKGRAVRTSVKTLRENFECKPYGWPHFTILCLLSRLWVRNIVELQSDGNVLDKEDELGKILAKTPSHGNTIIVLQTDFTPAQINSFREFYQDFFDKTDGSSDMKELNQKVFTALKELHQNLKNLKKDIAPYPFKEVLEPVFEKIGPLPGRFEAGILVNLLTKKTELLSLKSNILEPLRFFMNGSQKKIFDDAAEFLKNQQANFSYIEAPEKDEIEKILANKDCFLNSIMSPVKKMIDTLSTKIAEKITEELSEAEKKLSELQNGLCQLSDFSRLNDEQKMKITRCFQQFSGSLKKETLIAVIRDKIRNFEEVKYGRLLGEVASGGEGEGEGEGVASGQWIVASEEGFDLARPVVAESAIPVSPVVHPPKPAPPKFINIGELKRAYEKTFLENEADAENYLHNLREQIIAEIKKGNRIRL